MKKPPFGGVRSPKLWSNTVRKAMGEMHFYEHKLDACLYMSYKAIEKATVDSFEHPDGGHYELDGILGLHVDDFIGGGEHLVKVEDLEGVVADVRYDFLGRMKELTGRFKLGSIDLANEQIHCGIEMLQSKCCSSITLKCEAYMHKVRPLTIEKARRQQAADEATDGTGSSGVEKAGARTLRPAAGCTSASGSRASTMRWAAWPSP